MSKQMVVVINKNEEIYFSKTARLKIVTSGGAVPASGNKSTSANLEPIQHLF
jgi:hypothetical protein